MNRSFRVIIVFALAVGLMLGLGSFSKTEAVTLLGNDGTQTGDFKLSGCGGTCTYFAAYEFYGNQTVIAGEGVSIPDVFIKVKVGRDYSSGENASFRLTNGKFVSPSSQPGFGSTYCLYNQTQGNIAATQNGTYSWPTNQVYFTFVRSAAQDDVLIFGRCNSTGTTYYGISRYVQIDPNLGTSCTKGAVVKLEWFAADQDCCEANLIEIKTMGNFASKLNFTAELDTDKDFKLFVGDNNILDTCCAREGGASCPISSCSTCTDCLSSKNGENGSTSTCPKVWVLGDLNTLKNNAIVKLSFTVSSLNAEPGVDKIAYGDTACTKVSDTQWNCSFNCIKCPNCPEGDFLNVYLKGTEPNNPTIWNISNVQVANICQIDPAIKDICCSLADGEVGVWYGGLEALVPFVKHDPANGYYTTIKLISRYKSDVKVFVAPFTSSSSDMVLPTYEIGSITPGGSLTITGAQLASAFSGYDFASGLPVKLHLRVKGANSYIGKDPYVEGVVVSDRVGYGTRTIPLKFKTNLHGAFAE